MEDRPAISSDPSENAESDGQWRTAGDRIQTLLDSCAAGGAAAYERAQQLVREVVGLYGAGLERVVQLSELPGQDPGLLERLAADDLVASLLLVHGLHPHDVSRRINDALDSVRPYLGSHGGDVHLLEVAGDVVRLQFAGSCKSCPSSAVTLELAVEDAVRAAAPEISSIEVVAAEKSSGSSVIAAESLLTRVHANGHRPATWQQVPELAELAPGEVGGFMVAGTTALACRVGDEYYAYRDRCPGCDGSLAGARLHDAVLRCPLCGADYDAVHAGAAVDGELHLEPIPVLVRDGVLSMAVFTEEVAS